MPAAGPSENIELKGEPARPWYQCEVAFTLEQLDTEPEKGLSSAVAAIRLQQFGPNELKETAGRDWTRILWEQVSGAMTVLLIVAAAASVFLQEYTDAIVIAAIIVLNAGLGFAQDYRAEKALAALKKLAVPTVKVRRDARTHEISALQLVPGDLIFLESGHHVPADARLIDAANLQIHEAALTGESEPVEKQTAALPGSDLPLGDRKNMVYLGTLVTQGRGTAVVTQTGMDSELGNIAESLQTVKPQPTPLQNRLSQLGRTLALVAIAIVAVVFVFGLLRGEDLQLMLMTALSLAVAVVPEGLPAVATVALALGARRMYRKHALIRKLPAVETLGSVTVICSDKTGTLTENQMAVTVLDVAGGRIELPEKLAFANSDGVAAWSGEVDQLREQVTVDPSFVLLLAGARLCNDAEVQLTEQANRLVAVGDPTEAAMALAAARLGFDDRQPAHWLPRIAEIPFDSDRKRMTTVHRQQVLDAGGNELIHALAKTFDRLPGEDVAFEKGAVDHILDICDRVWDRNQILPLEREHRRRIDEAHAELAGSGMRVLGVAIKPLDAGWQENLPTGPGVADDPDGSQTDVSEFEESSVFIGMLAMIDPPRPEVAEAVKRCQTAGIRPVMITGDHPLTARYIAQQLEIAKDPRVLAAKDLDQLDFEELRGVAENVSVYARVSPRHKLQLVRALQENGHVVAMTGDGVNDAPAIKQAHIGIAMGITGTDVSKEASQMVLLDDNFATIVNAIEQGRIAYDNIRKFVKYTMTSNAGEVWVMVIGPLIGMPLPLLPLQILWINLVTDGLPGLALAMEKAERDTMRRPPYPPKQHIFDSGMARDVAWIGLLMGVVSLVLGYWHWTVDSANEAKWRTMIFTVLTLAQMGNALAIRSVRESVFQMGLFSNPALIGSVLLTFSLQMAVVYWPPLQNLFYTTSLSAGELIGCLALSTTVFWMVELQKLVMRIWSGRQRQALV